MTLTDVTQDRPNAPYFARYLNRQPPKFEPLSNQERILWHILAGATILFGFRYIHWRWTESLNPESMWFSILVASAETTMFLGTCLFFYDIWDEQDTQPNSIMNGKSRQGQRTEVDIFIATLDEAENILSPTIEAAQKISVPQWIKPRVWLLDDGNRTSVAKLAEQQGVGYFSRTTNRGFKAGNLANALYQTRGEFIVICDADTQLFPNFIANTLGYFDDPKVAWVQTPHWFFDIPEGQTLASWLKRVLGKRARVLSAKFPKLTETRIGKDPFLSDPSVFFDVIQRRRNRSGASFCCGAGSIHRRAVLFENSLQILIGQSSTDNDNGFSNTEQQPFKYHVSEDIFTSIQLHRRDWKSVYHPNVEARMLSPWSADAWAAQKLKYAGGTYDIMLRANPCWDRTFPARVKLHYLATFWSYAGLFWYPVLLLAPAFALFTGNSPVNAYSVTFFLHLLPMLLCGELALMAGLKGYDTYPGKSLAFGTLAIQAKAFYHVLLGRRPKFTPTSKEPRRSRNIRYAIPNIVLISVLLLSVFWAISSEFLGFRKVDASLLVINLFWIGCNVAILSKIIFLCLSVPANGQTTNEAL